MIRAHLATFPPRSNLVPHVLEQISPQVDMIYICLNNYTEFPSWISNFKNVEAFIPKTDLRDAGKFAFNVQPDDIVFTIDDDIFYPSDYVRRTLGYTLKLPLDANSIGYQANALVAKKDTDALGWKSYLFHKKCGNIFKMDILGTGTACLLGCNCPSLDDIIYSSGFVDIGFSRDQTRKGIHLWTLPREDKYLESILPKDLEASTLFNTVNRARSPVMISNLRKLISERTPRSGTKWDKLFSSETGTIDLEK